MSWVLEASMAKVMSPKPNSAVVTQRSRVPMCDGVLVGVSMAKVIPHFSRCVSEKAARWVPLALHQLRIGQASPAPSALDSSDTQNFLQVLLYGDQIKQCDGTVELDEQIHIVLRTSLIARHRLLTTCNYTVDIHEHGEGERRWAWS